MEKKIIVWMLGSNGSGKTTQSRKLVNNLIDSKERQLIQGSEGELNYCYTKYDNCIVIGKMEDNACTGIDSVFSTIKVPGLVLSMEKALKEKQQIIVFESIMVSMNWYRSLKYIFDKENVKLLPFFLDLNKWNNFKRIQQRRALKQGRNDWENVELEDTVYKNVGSKNDLFRKIASNFVELGEDLTTFNALENPDEIAKEVINKILINL